MYVCVCVCVCVSLCVLHLRASNSRYRHLSNQHIYLSTWRSVSGNSRRGLILEQTSWEIERERDEGKRWVMEVVRQRMEGNKRGWVQMWNLMCRLIERDLRSCCSPLISFNFQPSFLPFCVKRNPSIPPFFVFLPFAVLHSPLPFQKYSHIKHNQFCHESNAAEPGAFWVSRFKHVYDCVATIYICLCADYMQQC